MPKEAVKASIAIEELNVIKSMNIYEKMLHIQSEIPTVAKNLNVSTGKTGSYKAVSERDVKDAIKPLEEKYGVYSFPIVKELIEQTQLEQETQYGKKTSFYIREKVTYRFVNVHNPSEFIEIDGYGDGIDSGDKATGKADTYASKYCLMSAYKISTGDDPDKDASEEYSKKQPKQSQKPAVQTAPPDMAVEFTRLRGELAKVGYDLHDEKVANFIKERAKVDTVDPGILLGDVDAMSRVLVTMAGILKAKQS